MAVKNERGKSVGTCQKRSGQLEYVIRHWSREESTCSLNRVKFITSIRFIYQSQLFFGGCASAGAVECPRLLGLSTGAIADWQISSSSYLSAEPNDRICHAKFGRLHQSGNRSWCAKHRAVGEWILVDLGVQSQVTRVSLFYDPPH